MSVELFYVPGLVQHINFSPHPPPREKLIGVLACLPTFAALPDILPSNFLEASFLPNVFLLQVRTPDRECFPQGDARRA